MGDAGTFFYASFVLLSILEVYQICSIMQSRVRGPRYNRLKIFISCLFLNAVYSFIDPSNLLHVHCILGRLKMVFRHRMANFRDY